MPETTVRTVESPLFNLVAPSEVPLRLGTRTNKPADTQINAVLEDVLNSLQYSFAAAAADEPVAKPAPVDAMFREFLATRSPKARAAYAARATMLFKAPPAVRKFQLGRFAELNPKQYAGFDALRTTAPLKLDPQAFKAAIERNRTATMRLSLPPGAVEATQDNKIKLKIPIAPTETNQKNIKLDLGPEGEKLIKDAIEGAKYKKLGLFIKQVSCIEETNEPSDSDEINLGGVFVTADGKTHGVSEFMVSDDFDDGESVLYPKPVIPPDFLSHPEKLEQAWADAYAKPGKLFCEWDVRNDVGFPTAYTAAIVMAEKDDGGFWKFIKQLVAKVIEVVEDAIGKSLGTAIGAGIGAVIGNGWGAIIGGAIGFVVGAFIDWIFGDNPDDIMGTAKLVMSFGAATLSYYQWTGLLKKPHPDLFPLDFKKDGGHYRVKCYYQLY